LEGGAKRGNFYQKNKELLEWKDMVDSNEDGFFSQLHSSVSSCWVESLVFSSQKEEKIQWDKDFKPPFSIL
jgi:hypothetical protein